MAMCPIGRHTASGKVSSWEFFGFVLYFFSLLIRNFLARRKEGETAMKVCSTNWSNQWSDFVCQSLGFTETKTTNFRPIDSAESSASYLRLKDDSDLSSSKSLTGHLQPETTPCDTVEIKCSSKHRKLLFRMPVLAQIFN